MGDDDLHGPPGPPPPPPPHWFGKLKHSLVLVIVLVIKTENVTLHMDSEYYTILYYTVLHYTICNQSINQSIVVLYDNNNNISSYNIYMSYINIITR